MVLPLIPIIAGAVGGMFVEKGLTSIFGGTDGTTKKAMTIGGEYHAPYEVWSPTTTHAQTYQTQYSIAVDSPLARVGGAMEATASPDVAAGVSQAEGTDMTKIALVGAAGLIIYGITKRK